MNSKKLASLFSLLGVIVLNSSGCGSGGLYGSSVPITISVSPGAATVAPGASAQFTATVNGDLRNAGADWNLTCTQAGSNNQQVGSICGSLSSTHSASGAAITYTAPMAGNLSVTIQAAPVTAGSVCCVSASASVTVPGVGVAISPQNAPNLNLGGTTQLTATVTNDPTNKGVNWTVSCSLASCGSVSPTSTGSGVATTYTASMVPFGGIIQVTLTATSVANSGASAQVSFNVSGVNVSVAPPTASLEAGATQQFTATVINDATNSGVTWTLTQGGNSCSPACGTIAPALTASGSAATYTAPSTPPTSNTQVTVTATSVAQTGASAFATVTVLAITVSASPNSALLPAGVTQAFTATVNNDPTNGGVKWTLTQNGSACTATACGTLSNATANPVTYSSPAAVSASSSVTITATSATDATKSGNATINLATGTVEIVPDSIGFGSVLVSSTAGPQTVNLTNTGTTALSINGITTTNSVYSQANTCGSSVGASMSCTISVTFTPNSRGTFNENVSIADSSKDSPQQVSLTGTGFTKNGKVASVRSALSGTTKAAVPSPSGPYTVGTHEMDLTDSTRKDPYLNTGTNRELAIRFWYPASVYQKCQTADYTSPAVWAHFSQLVKVTPFPVATNSCLNAPMTDGPHPVVVFTPGYTATFTDYTFLFEDLASRGYIVASVAHTYETTAVQFSDGRLAKSVLGSHLDDSWHADEKTFASATSARLQDLEFVLNELERMNSQPSNMFSGQFDLSKIAIAGHSMGGITAYLGAHLDARFKAVVMLDAAMPQTLVSTTKTPVLLLAANSKEWDPGACGLWNNLAGPRLAVNFPGSEHVTFSDWIWLAKGGIQTGSMGPDKTMAAVRDYVAAFLDANLRGELPSQLLNGSAPNFPDAVVITQEQSLCGHLP